MNPLIRVAFAFAALLLPACRHLAPRAECADHGGAEWREVTSAHFRIYTNLDSEEASEAAAELERARRTLLFAWRHQIDPPGRVEVVILQNAGHLREFSPFPGDGFMVRNGLKPVIAVTRSAFGEVQEPTGAPRSGWVR